MCAATIAFMDIKSASKAHLVEHKFEDRILTTEYYEPSAMHHGSAEGGSSLVINSKMGGDGAAISAVGDIKDTMTHGRFASTSSHGLVYGNQFRDLPEKLSYSFMISAIFQLPYIFPLLSRQLSSEPSR